MSDSRLKSIAEHDVVALREDVPSLGLSKDAEGTVVYLYRPEGPYEVEFLRPGQSPVIATMEASCLEKVWDAETRCHLRPRTVHR